MTLMISAFKILLAEEHCRDVLAQGNLPSTWSLTREILVLCTGYLSHKYLSSLILFSDGRILLCLVKVTARLTGTSPFFIFQILKCYVFSKVTSSVLYKVVLSHKWQPGLWTKQKKNTNNFGFYSESPKSHRWDYICNSVSRNFTF